jgi:hypothetical protein
MAKKGTDAAATAAAGVLAGVGLGVFLAMAFAGDSTDRRGAFLTRLRASLAPSGVELLAADVAQGTAAPMWVLTLRLPNHHVLTLHAELHAGQELLSVQTADDIAGRLLQFFASRNWIEQYAAG